jgi:hypothetical protein
VPLCAFKNERNIGVRLAGETPSGGELLGRKDGAIGVRGGERAGEHAHAAAPALAHAAAGEFDAVGGETGNKQTAARHVELDGERFQTDADGIGGHWVSPTLTRIGILSFLRRSRIPGLV